MSTNTLPVSVSTAAFEVIMKRSSLALLLGLYSSIVFSAEILPLSDGLTLAQISVNG